MQNIHSATLKTLNISFPHINRVVRLESYNNRRGNTIIPTKTAIILPPAMATFIRLPDGALFEASLFPVTEPIMEDTTPPIPPLVVLVAVPAPVTIEPEALPEALAPTETLIVAPAAPVGTGCPS